MNTRAPTPGKLVVIAGFTLTCFGLLLFLWLAFGGAIPFKPEGYRVKIAFPDAATLADQADVRTAGVKIGRVVAKQLAPEGNKTLVTIQLDRRYAPMKADAHAILREKTLLGETYIEVTRGSASAPDVKEGARLPDGQVKPAVEFDQVLQIFDKPTREVFRQFMASTAQANAGRGRDISDSLGNLPVLTENAASVSGVLADRRAALRDLVKNTGRTFQEISSDEGALSTLVRRNTELFDELSRRQQQLASSVRLFPAFLDQSKRTLARLQTFSAKTTPLITDLKPALDDLQPTLHSLGELSPDLENLFDNIDPLITAGHTGLPALSNVLHGVDPTLTAAGPFLQQVNPLLRYLEYNQVKVSDFLDIAPSTLGGIRATPPGSPSNGHVLPQIIMTGIESLPALQRGSGNRGNAYLKPDARRDPEKLILPSFDCGSSGEKGPTNTPGCRVQGPVPFEGAATSFPNVAPAQPGGRLTSLVK
jgi:virulence factor Mce-like protein